MTIFKLYVLSPVKNESRIIQDHIIRKFVSWGKEHSIVRAMILTSTRAIPNAHLDLISDYDVILIVSDVVPFYEDRS